MDTTRRPAPAPKGFRVPAVAGGLACAYTALAMLVTAPAWVAPTRRLVGAFEGPDLVGTAWTWWWTGHALSTGQNPARTDMMYFPDGLYPVAQFNLVDALLAAPFHAIAGPVLAYDLGVLLLLVLSGLAMHWTCRLVGTSHLAAFVGGAALLASQLTTWEVWGGRVGQAFTGPLVLSLGLWHRVLFGAGRWPWAVGAGLASALTFLSYWYYGLFLGLGVGVMLIAALVERRAPTATLRTAAVGLAATLIPIAPAVFALVGPGSTLPGVGGTEGWNDHGALARGDGGLNWAMDFCMWVGWPLGLGGATMPEIDLWLHLPLFALVPLLVVRAGRGRWLLVAAVGWLISLGPYAVGADGQVLSTVPMPFLWLYDHMPFFDRLWWPYRAGVLLVAAFCVLAARNIDDLSAELGRAAPLLPLGALLLVGAEVMWRDGHTPVAHSTALEPSSVYAHIDAPVITVPLFGDDANGRFALWLQPAHRQPLLYGLGGHVDGHRPAAVDALVRDNALLAALTAYEQQPPARLELPPEDVAELLDLGFGWVLVDRKLFGHSRAAIIPDLVAQAVEGLLGTPYATDDRAALWKLSPLDATVVLDPAPGWNGRSPELP